MSFSSKQDAKKKLTSIFSFMSTNGNNTSKSKQSSGDDMIPYIVLNKQQKIKEMVRKKDMQIKGIVSNSLWVLAECNIGGGNKMFGGDGGYQKVLLPINQVAITSRMEDLYQIYHIGILKTPYRKERPDELTITRLGDVVEIFFYALDDWCYARYRNQFGWFPKDFLTIFCWKSANSGHSEYLAPAVSAISINDDTSNRLMPLKRVGTLQGHEGEDEKNHNQQHNQQADENIYASLASNADLQKVNEQQDQMAEWERKKSAGNRNRRPLYTVESIAPEDDLEETEKALENEKIEKEKPFISSDQLAASAENPLNSCNRSEVYRYNMYIKQQLNVDIENNSLEKIQELRSHRKESLAETTTVVNKQAEQEEAPRRSLNITQRPKIPPKPKFKASMTLDETEHSIGAFKIKHNETERLSKKTNLYQDFQNNSLNRTQTKMEEPKRAEKISPEHNLFSTQTRYSLINECNKRYENYLWYHGTVASANCKKAMMLYANLGQFLIHANEDQLELMIKAYNDVLVFPIETALGNPLSYMINGKKFSCLILSVCYFSTNELGVDSQGSSLVLTKPFSRVFYRMIIPAVSG